MTHALQRKAGALLLAGLLTAPLARGDEAAQQPKRPAPPRPRIQLAILLDTSGSMNGLINQARSQLWRIVNQMALTRRKGALPRLELALFEYGKNSVPASQGYIRCVVPLSTDLDKVSEELFALATNGGNEYCGQAIRTAVRGLAWSKDARDFKAIFIAGNEAFTQGTVDYKEACREAIGRGIVVNTIHCGPRAQGVAGMWEDGARLADGQFLVIDQNRVAPQISAPQDQQLGLLNEKLNKTYLAYGRAGELSAARQRKQDKNAKDSGGGAAAQRAEAKAGKLYDSSGWDLVDAEKSKKVKLEELEEEQLPAPMRKMTPEQRKAHLAQMSKQRAELQKQIQQLVEQRKQYVNQKRKEQAAQGAKTFDQAVLEAVRKQLAKKGYELKQK